MEDRRLLTLALESLDRAEENSRYTREQIERLAGISATLITLLRRADAQSANGRLQQQAAMNEIMHELNWLKGTVLTPEGLAGVASRSVIDKARQIKRSNEIALTGKDPMAARKRDDEITLVSIKIHGEKRKWRLSKRAALGILASLFSALGTVAGWLIRHLAWSHH